LAQPELKQIAQSEDIPLEKLEKYVKEGREVIVKNARRKISPLAIGEGTRVKTNSNVGSSQLIHNLSEEVEKARISVKYGIDTVMDLSTGGTEDDLRSLQETLLKEISVPIGTVPIYQAAVRMHDARRKIIDMTEDDLLHIVEEQAKRGIDFFTIHAGVQKYIVEHLVKHPRLMGVVSRGGTFLAAWILHHNQENPFLTNFDALLDILAKYDVAISLGDGFRPGSIFDATDYCQIQELLEISRLVDRCRERKVSVIVEGPGHIPAQQVTENIRIEKAVCKGAPFYVLGPIVTDIAPGYDELVGAIGGVLAGLAGADYLCYVTPAEHLGLPTLEDVKKGVIASRIAAHAVDVARSSPSALAWDHRMDVARKALDWEEMFRQAVDPEVARQRHERQSPNKGECTMCGPFCALKLLDEYTRGRFKLDDIDKDQR
jgi:phosphomethylpyrimidine synthase